MKLIIHPAIDPDRLAAVQAAWVGDVVSTDDEGEVLEAATDAEAFFGKISPEILARARSLRWIQSPTASLEHYLFPELVRHPVVLTNMRGIFSDVIADHVMGYVLCFARNLHVYVRQQTERRWSPRGGEDERQSFAVGAGAQSSIDRHTIHLSGQTMGVIGFGAIGREIARRASAFGLRVLAIDAQVDRSAERDSRPLPEDVEAVWDPRRLDELLARSDFVCIAAPHTPLTYKLVRRGVLQGMKRSAYLINIGRGVIVDLDDLCAALDAGEIAGAALDVFEVEPLPADHPLWGYENVIITPHVAGASPRVPERHLEVLVENLRRFQRGDPLLNVVDKEKWY